MKTSKQILSLLLAVVMVLGLVPVMASAATYTKAGEITQITLKSTGFVTPALEGEVTLPYLTVISPKDQRIRIYSDAVFTYWQKKDANGAWSKYTAPLFEEGIYRLHIAMFNIALDDGSYYALSGNTALTVDGTPWPTVGLFEDHYSETGRGELEYYSPEYRVTAPAGYYKVTVTGDGNGTVSADVFYGKVGQTVTLTATPNRMYRLKQWQVISGGVTIANDQFVMGNSAVEIRAEFESFMVNAGEIDRVEVKSQEDLRPVLGRPLSYDMEVTDPQDVNVQIRKAWTRWEKLQPDGSWKTYIDPTFTYGTYRMMVLLRSDAFEDGRYYPITKNTRLFVDGVEWTQIEAPRGSYTPEKTYGTAYYAGPVMEAIPLLTVSDSCLHCSVVPVSGDLTLPMGDDFSFTIEPDDYYELTDPTALKVYANDKLITPDANGVYTVKNATEDLDIYADGGFTAYADILITANGVTVKEKVYAGQSYTLKTVAGYGATVPGNSSFTHWKVSGLGKYQPGQSFTVNGGGEIRIDAVFSGLYNITVVGGTAYADAAHTKPLSVAAEDQVIYIVADPAPEGKVFSIWSWNPEIDGHYSWSSINDAHSASTWFTVSNCGITWTPVYETLVDEIIINGMTKPTPGVAVDNSDWTYKWGCSVPADAGYRLSICYWYDITTGEPVSMSSGDVFQIGHKYRFEADVYLPGNGDTIFPQNAEDISVALSGFDAEDYEWTINEIGYTSATIYFEFTCDEEPVTGVTVSGTVTRSNSDTDEVTVQLIPDGSSEVAYETVVKGNATSYSLSGVADGRYTLKVQAEGGRVRCYEITVAGESVCQDVSVVEYTVTFQNWNGSVITTATYFDGETVEVPADPVRQKDNTYTYTFSGWDKEVVACAGHATYRATYTSEYIDYTVVFMDADGKQLSKATYHYGDTVVAPEAPTKEADSTYTYTFSGWDKEVVACAGNAIYRATYTSEYIDYTVVFMDADGKQLSKATYHYGDTVVVPKAPTKEADSTYTYTFSGWDQEVVPCTKDAVYTAVFTAHVRGVRVSGTVTSFGSETDNVIVQLIAEGYSEADYEVFVKGNTAAYSIEGVAAGTYTLRVVKNNHVARTYTVTVGIDPVVQNVKIHLRGDIDGNGKVNVGDTAKVYAHVKNTAEITDEYMLLCADVSGDGKINVGDTAKIYAHVKNTSLLW